MVVSEVPEFDDVRLTDFDAVLVRHDVESFRVKTDNFKAMFAVPVNENTVIEVKRGYVMVDVRFRGHKYRFVNTHLEDPSLDPELEFLQYAQAQELVKMLDNQAHPVIMVGDFNSVAPAGITYQYLLSQRFTDVWQVNTIPDNLDGFTYGHEAGLRNPNDEFYERIDYIFLRNKVRPFRLGPVSAWVVGDEDFVFSTYGIWPSDHGGVVASFQMPKWNNPMALH
jgi:endonuclease/exonuclease/phosphatase family metal-dependent hydrolase